MESEERRRFEAIVLPHLDAAYNLARWLSRDEHATEDLVQEALYRAARYFASFNGTDARPWLLGIIRRATYDWSKSRGAAISLDLDLHDAEDVSQNLELIAVTECRQEDVRRALEALPVPLREVMILREVECLSYQQIADVIDSPVGTVMSRLSRGRQQLQGLLTSAMDAEK